jgi:hypothetical protein
MGPTVIRVPQRTDQTAAACSAAYLGQQMSNKLYVESTPLPSYASA